MPRLAATWYQMPAVNNGGPMPTVTFTAYANVFQSCAAISSKVAGSPGAGRLEIVHTQIGNVTVNPATGLPIGETRANLKSAIAGETHEYSDMYPGMAKAARTEGFAEIADWFETLAKAERSHANRFQKALDTL